MMLFAIPYNIRLVIWRHTRDMRARATVVGELEGAMRLTRAVNDILADDVNIGPGSVDQCWYRDALRLLHRCPIRSAPAAFDDMLGILSGMPLGMRRDGIRICLWQYCKILPVMSMVQVHDFCDLYYRDTGAVSCWMVSVIGFVCGIVVGTAYLADIW